MKDFDGSTSIQPDPYLIFCCGHLEPLDSFYRLDHFLACPSERCVDSQLLDFVQAD